ncbi:hypothetical protein [Streptomyces sp. NPDC091215]|uniref:hypothetical protein n=1 Tax=Streptomyces sp. NPDC091215 TaxID=3155192 RepID=UPI00342AD886
MLVAAFLVVDGLIHLAVWLPADAAEQQPFDPGRSWALAAAGRPGPDVAALAAVGLASASALLFEIAGVAAATRADWTVPAVTGAVVGPVLKTLWFNRWLAPGLLLDGGLIFAVLTLGPGAHG